MSYIDGVVCAVPTANKEKFIAHAKLAALVFKDHGALQVVECWESDVPEGKVTSFPMAVHRREDESIVFSWITWPSKAVRDLAWEKAMHDPRLSPETNPMPFDGQRMIFGGFDRVVDA